MRDLLQLLAALTPGTEVTVLRFRVPRLDAPAASISEPDSDGRHVDPIPNSPSAGLQLVHKKADVEPEPEGRRADESALSACRRLLQEHPGLTRKIDEWADLIGCSERELRRAVAHGALDRRRKGGGKDNRAVVVSAADLVTYLGTIEAVERGALDAPDWYVDVRRGAAA